MRAVIENEEGHFISGGMGSKVKTCIRFLKYGGMVAIITSLEKVLEALRGEIGPKIIMSHGDV